MLLDAMRLVDADTGEQLVLTPAADNGGVIKIVDFNPGYPAVRVVQVPNPGYDGASDYTRLFGAKAVALVLKLDPSAGLPITAALTALRAWCAPARRVQLYYTPGAGRPVTPPPPNLLANPSFETDLTGWTVVGGLVSRVSAAAHDGVWSARVVPGGVDTTPRLEAGGAAAVPVIEGQSVTVSAWVLPATGNFPIGITVNWFTAAGGYVTTALSNTVVPVAGVWRLLSLTTDAPVGIGVGGAGARVQIVGGGTPPGVTDTIHVDQLRLQINETPTNPAGDRGVFAERVLYLRGEQLAAELTRDVILFGNADVQLQWSCPAGIEFSAQTVETEVKLQTPITTGGRIYPRTYPRLYPAQTGTGVAVVTNAGTVASAPLIRVFGPVTGPVITNETSGEVFAMAGYVLGATEYLEVDIAAKTVQLRGEPGANANRRSSVTTPAWWTLRPGANIIRFSATAGGTPAQLLVRSQDAWI